MGGEEATRTLDVEDVRAALASADPARRAWAITHAPNDPRLEQALIASLGDPYEAVRRACVVALLRIRGPAAATALMRASWGDPSPSVRAEAVAAIGRILESRLVGS